METAAFDRATAAVAPTDRRERRTIALAAIVVLLVAAAAVALWQTGVVRPRIEPMGTTVTSVNLDRATIHVDVTNRGAVAEHLVSATADVDWAVLQRAWLSPDPLGPGEQGQLSMEFIVDCHRAPPAAMGTWLVRLETQRPWGTTNVALSDVWFSGLEAGCGDE